MPSPALWGDEATVRDRLRSGIATLKLTPRLYRFEYPFPPDAVVEFFRANYGPMTRAFAALDANGQKTLRSELVRLWAEHNTAAGDTTLVAAEYLEVVATREGKRTERVRTKADQETGSATGSSKDQPSRRIAG